MIHISSAQFDEKNKSMKNDKFTIKNKEMKIQRTNSTSQQIRKSYFSANAQRLTASLENKIERVIKYGK